MKVSMFSYSSSAVEGVHTLEEQVAYAARVSNPSNQMNMETAPKLIDYLIRNHHWSPLEMAHVTLEIETTRDIARQILRHRSFSFQEFSQRYADASQLGFVLKECRLQDAKNRQNSLDVASNDLKQSWEIVQSQVMNTIKDAYKWALDHGIAKEQARAVLPEGMTVSRMYMAGTLRSWWHYIQLRSSNGTQKEHREIALECANVIGEVFPLIKTAISK